MLLTSSKASLTSSKNAITLLRNQQFFTLSWSSTVVAYLRRLLWLQSSRNHILRNATNVGDFVDDAQNNSLCQTIAPYPFGWRRWPFFHNAFHVIRSAISVDVSVKLLYQILILHQQCITFQAKNPSHHNVLCLSMDLTCFCLNILHNCIGIIVNIYWKKRSAKGTIEIKTTNDSCNRCHIGTASHSDQNPRLARNSNAKWRQRIIYSCGLARWCIPPK